MTAPDPPAEAGVGARRPTEHPEACGNTDGPRNAPCVYPRHHEVHWNGADTVWVEVHADADQIRKVVLAQVDAALRKLNTSRPLLFTPMQIAAALRQMLTPEETP